MLADQAAKVFLSGRLAPSESIPVIKNIFHITLVHNKGMAFGLLADAPAVFFLCLSAAAVCAFFYFFTRLKDDQAPVRFAVMLMAAGTLGNLIDRVRLGYIVDFLDFRVWPVFNIADGAITVGAGIFILAQTLKLKKQTGGTA